MGNQSRGAQSETGADGGVLNALAFVALVEMDKDVYRGGVLVTDAQGKPLEFRCTSAIQPTAVQKALYGGTLKAHMAVELTARPLLAALQERCDAVLVTQHEFTELRTQIDKPLLMVWKQGSSPAVPEDGDNSTGSEVLASPAGKFEPLVITSHWQHPEDVTATLPDLGNLFSRFDLVEPFARIENALKLLHEKGAVPAR